MSFVLEEESGEKRENLRPYSNKVVLGKSREHFWEERRRAQARLPKRGGKGREWRRRKRRSDLSSVRIWALHRRATLAFH